VGERKASFTGSPTSGAANLPLCKEPLYSGSPQKESDMTTEPNTSAAEETAATDESAAPAAPAVSKSKPVSKSVKLSASDIPAEEWDKLVSETGTSVSAVGKTIRAVAAFCQTHAALSARDMAAYMASHYTSGALSHTTIAQHKRLDLSLTGAVDASMLSDELYGKARSLFADAAYSWERWEAALSWESVAAMTHSGERSAHVVKLIGETYSAAQSETAQQAAETAKAKAAEERKLTRERKAAEAAEERAAEIAEATAEATERAEKAEAALSAALIIPGSPESWERLTLILGDFLPFAVDMPRHTGAALAALMAASRTAGESTAPAAPAQRKPRAAQSKRELAAA